MLILPLSLLDLTDPSSILASGSEAGGLSASGAPYLARGLLHDLVRTDDLGSSRIPVPWSTSPLHYKFTAFNIGLMFRYVQFHFQEVDPA